MTGPIFVTVSAHVAWWVRPLLAVLSPIAGLLPSAARAWLACLIARFGVRTEVSL